MVSCVGGGGGGGLVRGRRGDPPPFAATFAGANGIDGPTYAPEIRTIFIASLLQYFCFYHASLT